MDGGGCVPHDPCSGDNLTALSDDLIRLNRQAATLSVPVRATLVVALLPDTGSLDTLPFVFGETLAADASKLVFWAEARVCLLNVPFRVEPTRTGNCFVIALYFRRCPSWSSSEAINQELMA